MRLIATPIPAESHEIAIWPDLPPGDEDTGEPIETVCNLHHLTQYECRVTKAKGHLSDEINIAIGLKALELGYRIMHYTVKSGSGASHRGEYLKTVGDMDYYRVDLIKAAAEL